MKNIIGTLKRFAKDKKAAISVIALIMSIVMGAVGIKLGAYTYYSVDANMPSLNSDDYNTTSAAVDSVVGTAFNMSPLILLVIVIVAILSVFGYLGGAPTTGKVEI